jgi:adenine C2-methylase RlmN of 23S rRNA A2503 and tRNA A37
VLVEYVMLAGINDSEEVAHLLGALLKEHEVVGFGHMHLTFWINILPQCNTLVLCCF